MKQIEEEKIRGQEQEKMKRDKEENCNPKAKAQNKNKGKTCQNKVPSHPLNPPSTPYPIKTTVRSPTKLIGPQIHFKLSPTF